jgi:hypothetical protein
VRTAEPNDCPSIHAMRLQLGAIAFLWPNYWLFRLIAETAVSVDAEGPASGSAIPLQGGPRSGK